VACLMTTASWGPEKGSTAGEKTDGLCGREMNRGRCANMWVSTQVHQIVREIVGCLSGA